MRYLALIFTLYCVNYANAVTVISINTEFFWDANEPHEGRIVGYGQDENIKPPTSKEFEIEAFAFAKTIEAQNADIVGLVEIENEVVAKAILKYLPNNWRHVFLKGRDNYTGQDVAVLTRFSLIDETASNFKDSPNSGAFKRPSKILGVGLKNSGESYYVVVTHLISKAGDNDAKRKKQAHAVRKIINDEFNNYNHVIVLGDLNDTPGSPALRKIKGSGSKKLVQLADTSLGTDDYSYIYRGEKQLIDHILVSQSLINGSEDFYAIDYPEALTDHRSVVFKN